MNKQVLLSFSQTAAQVNALHADSFLMGEGYKSLSALLLGKQEKSEKLLLRLKKRFQDR